MCRSNVHRRRSFLSKFLRHGLIKRLGCTLSGDGEVSNRLSVLKRETEQPDSLMDDMEESGTLRLEREKHYNNALRVSWRLGLNNSIAATDFKEALTGVLNHQHCKKRGTRVGLAISGGVDSMALATLYAQALQDDTNLPKPHGFIVDHKVRPESTEEAKWVAEEVRSKLGIQSTILTLTWPKQLHESSHKGFETKARTLRYQALGRACREMKIVVLMVAHHAEDQAETIMMRIAQHRLRSGLQGIRGVEWIPECEGIHGVYHSSTKQRENTGAPFPIEQGGVQLLRPLLEYPKKRLIATCEEMKVAWKEDMTNQDRTMTARNAVRHIFKNHKLPEALSVLSLVEVSQYMQLRVDKHKRFARALFRTCLMMMNIRTGSLYIEFLPSKSLLHRLIRSDDDIAEARGNAYCLLEQVIEPVTPGLRREQGALAPLIDLIWPDLGLRGTEKVAAAESQLTRSAHCVNGVWWRRWEKECPFHPSRPPKDNHVRPRDRTWLLTRQPLRRGEELDPAIRMVIPPIHEPPHHALGALQPRECEYRFFDNRFWICILNLTTDTLVLRMFQHKDYVQLASGRRRRCTRDHHQKNHATDQIYAALSRIKPADIRFTLPAIFRVDSATGQETLVDLPTLNVGLDGLGLLHDVCGWHVRYKKIDLRNREPRDVIVDDM